MSIPIEAQAAILLQSVPVPEDAIPVEGPDFDNPIGLHDLLRSYERIGFQATSFGRAVEIIDKMVSVSVHPKSMPLSSITTMRTHCLMLIHVSIVFFLVPLNSENGVYPMKSLQK